MVSATKFDHSPVIQVRLLTFKYNAQNIHVDSPLCSRAICGPEINTPFHACFTCKNVPMGDTTINFTAVENGEYYMRRFKQERRSHLHWCQIS
jgi:hypothetical protein